VALAIVDTPRPSPDTPFAEGSARSRTASRWCGFDVSDAHRERSPVMATIQPRRLVHSQNFLRRPGLVHRLLERSGIGPDDLVYDIGAGAGALTAALADRCRAVVAVEQDPQFAAVLRARFAGAAKVTIIEGDFLQRPPTSGRYKVFASIPFDRTTAIVTRLTTGQCPTEDAYLVMQAEAAARLLGQPRETLFAVLLKPWFEPTVFHRFRRTDFAPAPRVDVVMLRLRKRGPPLVAREDARLFRDLVTHCFTARRPSVFATLDSLLGRGRARRLARVAGLPPEARPSEVPFEVWLQLLSALQPVAGPALAVAVTGAEQRLRHQQRALHKLHRTRRSGHPMPRRVLADECRPPPAPDPGDRPPLPQARGVHRPHQLQPTSAPRGYEAMRFTKSSSPPKRSKPAER
jgi:23S rRNA (adenine-N6)-dimethyltransferase